jgi:hypothetical protein
MSRRAAFWWMAVSLSAGCSGKTTIYEISGAGASAGALLAAGGRSAAGGSMGGAGAPLGSSGLGALAGGESGVGGVSGTANAAGFGGSFGGMGLAGVAGVVETAGAAGVGTCQIVPDVPADCHATLTCFGSNALSRVVDQTNVPTPESVCLAGTCNSAGTPSTEAVPAGAPCMTGPDGLMCDGEGNCVRCLHSSDCPAGQACSAAHDCVSASCTDTDCGGVCAPCIVGKKCLVDTDCASNACDTVSLTCITSQCADHRQDGEETDSDCGGGICPACGLGEGCQLSGDCSSQACDAVSRRCITNQCADHQQDGNESDVDCGGTVCNACQVGQKCRTGIDCQSGRICNPGTPHLCE